MVIKLSNPFKNQTQYLTWWPSAVMKFTFWLKWYQPGGSARALVCKCHSSATEVEKNLNEQLSRKCKHLWVSLFSDLFTKYRPQNVSLSVFTGSKQVGSNSSPAFLPFSSMLHALENQRGEKYRCQKGKYIYAHLVIIVIRA